MVVQWQDSAGGFVTRSGNANSPYACYTTNETKSVYTDDGS
jgi:hypothetical protein